MAQDTEVRFNFSNASVESPEPIFLHSQGVQGSVLIDAGDDYQFDTVKLILEGMSTIAPITNLPSQR